MCINELCQLCDGYHFVCYHEHVTGDWIGQVRNGGVGIMTWPLAASTFVRCLTSGAAAWLVSRCPVETNAHWNRRADSLWSKCALTFISELELHLKWIKGSFTQHTIIFKTMVCSQRLGKSPYLFQNHTASCEQTVHKYNNALPIKKVKEPRPNPAQFFRARYLKLMCEQDE